MTAHYEQPHPLPRDPRGWFAVGLSQDLPRGAVRPVSAVGRDLVLFRTQGGIAAVLDAYCPHLGAHLGYGGSIDGEMLRCPFHKWGFEPGGRCVDIPYAGMVPARAVTGSLPVVERNGAVLAWFSSDGGAPEWDVPELQTDGWSTPRWLERPYKAHIQEFAENGVDKGHFPIVHKSARAGVEIRDATGIPFRFALQTAYPGDGIGLPGQHIDVDTEWSLFGVSVYLGVSTATDFGTQIRQLFHFTPIPGDEVLVRVGFSANLTTIPAEMLEDVQDKNLQILIQNFDEDREIWAHKRYLTRPVLCSGDGPFGSLRRWTRQFYVTSAQDGPARTQQPDTAEDLATEAVEDPAAAETGACAAQAPSQPQADPSAPAAVTVRETIFAMLPASFDPEATRGRDFVVQYHISGESGGLYTVTVADGACTPVEGEHPSPTVSVFVDADDWLKINAGTLNRAKAFVTGRLKVRGDMKLAYRLGEIFRPTF